MSSNRYSVNVRMGNWLEEICLQSETIKLYLARRGQTESLDQQTQRTNAELLRPIVLDAGDEFLRYGENTQIVCPEISFPDSQAPGAGSVLSYSATERQSSKRNGLSDPDFAVTASPQVKPCVRNCFKICRVESARCEDGEPLMFGDTFTISPCVSHKPLFIAADAPRMNAERGQSGHSVLKLVSTPDAYCRWTVAYWDSALRLEAEGLPVLKGVRVILVHKTTNQNVTVETDFPQSTFFGNEYEICADSCKGSGGRGEGRNIWQFTTGRPKSDGDDAAHEQ